MVSLPRSYAEFGYPSTCTSRRAEPPLHSPPRVYFRPRQQALVFQPFERLNAGRTAVEGTGIGLSLSKSPAELMNGTAGFNSRLDEGSDFWVELPAAQPPLGALVLYALPSVALVRNP
jgi:hypothetical protein